VFTVSGNRTDSGYWNTMIVTNNSTGVIQYYRRENAYLYQAGTSTSWHWGNVSDSDGLSFRNATVQFADD
jgi:hypothetical protein